MLRNYIVHKNSDNKSMLNIQGFKHKKYICILALKNQFFPQLLSVNIEPINKRHLIVSQPRIATRFISYINLDILSFQALEHT